jgi:hypothetical protein
MARDDRQRPFTFGADAEESMPWRPSVPGWLKAVVVLALAGGAVAGYLHLVDPDLGRRILADNPIAPRADLTTVYKWRDAAGGWQLTDRPPPAGTPYELLHTRGARNVVPADQVIGQRARRAE